MANFLEEQIEFLSRQIETIHPEAGEVAALFDLEVALSLAVESFNLLRRQAARACPPDSWNEAAARQLLPEYHRWFTVGQKLLMLIRDFKRRGHLAEGTGGFMQAYMECKPLATAFDDLVAAHERWARGDRSKFRPLREIVDELRPPH